MAVIDGLATLDFSAETLIEALRLIHAGERIFPRAVATGLSNSIAAVSFGDQILTPREMDIVSRLARGSSNKEIARDLGITESTVKVLPQKLLRKVRVKNRRRLRSGP